MKLTKSFLLAPAFSLVLGIFATVLSTGGIGHADSPGHTPPDEEETEEEPCEPTGAAQGGT